MTTSPALFAAFCATISKLGASANGLKVLKNGCVKSVAGFERPLVEPNPQIAGKDVPLDEAVALAAKTDQGKPSADLRRSWDRCRRHARHHVDRRAAAAALSIMRLSEGQYRNFRVLQSSGWVMTTLTEARNRADLFIIAGSDIQKLHPRFFERIVCNEAVDVLRHAAEAHGRVPRRRPRPIGRHGQAHRRSRHAPVQGRPHRRNSRSRCAPWHKGVDDSRATPSAACRARPSKICSSAARLQPMASWFGRRRASTFPNADLTVQAIVRVHQRHQPDLALRRPFARRQRRRGFGRRGLRLAIGLSAARLVRERQAGLRYRALCHGALAREQGERSPGVARILHAGSCRRPTPTCR